MSSAPAEKIVYTCPACMNHSLVRHCDNRSCTWMMCRRVTECDLVYDERTSRGHMLGEVTGVKGARPRVRWVKP